MISFKYNPDTFAYIETRQHNQGTYDYQRNQYAKVLKIPPEGLFGGISLLWKNNIECKIKFLKTNEGVIHYKIRDNKKDSLAGDFYLQIY